MEQHAYVVSQRTVFLQAKSWNVLTAAVMAVLRVTDEHILTIYDNDDPQKL